MSSELITSLAKKFGASESLIVRSAEARAAADGSTPDAVLSNWSGGSTAPAPSPPAPIDESPAVEVEPEPTDEIVSTAEPPTPGAGDRSLATSEEAPTVEKEPAVSEPDTEVRDEPRAAEPAGTIESTADPEPAGSLVWMLVASLTVFIVMFTASVIGPSFGDDGLALDAVAPLVLSTEAAAGRDVYLAEGCGTCHTQQVRPVVTDADLGIITLADTPLVPGLQRRGPDLTHAGSREPTDDADWLAGFLRNPEDARDGVRHSSFRYLSATDLELLVAYLLESK